MAYANLKGKANLLLVVYATDQSLNEGLLATYQPESMNIFNN